MNLAAQAPDPGRPPPLESARFGAGIRIGLGDFSRPARPHVATELPPGFRWALIPVGLALAAGGFQGIVRAQDFSSGQPGPVLTHVADIRRLASQNPDASYSLRLEADVWWASREQGKIILHDESGSEEVEVDLKDAFVQAGERVRLEGIGTLSIRGAGVRLGVNGAVVDNNGVHGMIEKSGSAYLKAGRHPIRVDWFNGVEKSGLKVEYQGPGVPRRRIPDSALFLNAEDSQASAASQSLHGVRYRHFSVPGELMPDFGELRSGSNGVVSNFDIRPAGGREHTGMQFTGYLEVPRDGLYTFYTTSDDGSRLFVGEPLWRAVRIGESGFPRPHRVAIGQTLQANEESGWVEVEGKVNLVLKRDEGVRIEMSAGGGRLRVEVADGPGLLSNPLLNARVRAEGFCEDALTSDGETVPGVLYVPDGRQIRIIKPAERTEELNLEAVQPPVLDFASEVHRLKRNQAERGYPVRLRGVVTSVLPEHQAFTIQDSTRGLYVVDSSPSRSAPPDVGEFLEVEGVTDPSLFAPIVDARIVRCVGAGRLPNPVQPTWDQLINGSMDAQYVEIQGIVTAVTTNAVTLRTRGGVINAALRVNGSQDLSHYENALVRLRGCLFASWDYATHQVKVGDVRVYNAEVILDQPAPEDLFSSPSKTPAELLLFDPQAGVFERVKVAGQIVYVREPEYFLMEGGHGLRVFAKQPAGLEAGNLVEMVGFPELSANGSPILREAVARVTGQAPLPTAQRVKPEDLLHTGHDLTRIRVEGVLASVRRTGSDEMLEMQSGVRTFVARWNAKPGPEPELAIGSRLELVGVYLGQGGNRAAGQDFASFELLLGSAADVTVIARPPWWTLQRLLVIVGALACVLAATMLWITQLHRQVDERTAQLGEQIRERQHVENQRAMEQERARIAQDLHDELGSGITEITMLAARAESAMAEEKRRGYLAQVGDRAREMVTALDEIVWAMNPRHNSLASLVSYFSLYADRFLGLANVAWRLEAPVESPDCAMDSRQRHQLFLAFKEALNNVVRHAGATEVRLAFKAEPGRLHLTIADNGHGIPRDPRTDEMNGVANMRERIVKLRGIFEVTSTSEQGTVLHFSVPSNS